MVLNQLLVKKRAATSLQYHLLFWFLLVVVAVVVKVALELIGMFVIPEYNVQYITSIMFQLSMVGVVVVVCYTRTLYTLHRTRTSSSTGPATSTGVRMTINRLMLLCLLLMVSLGGKY